MKFRKLFLLSITFMLFLSLTVSAQSAMARTIGIPFAFVLCEIFVALRRIVPAIGVLIIALAGALWLYSQDDAAKRNVAKTWIIHAIIGLIIYTLVRTLSYVMFLPHRGFTC